MSGGTTWSLQPGRWERVKDIFVLAAAATAGPARTAILDRECGDDSGLRAEVESLLESYQETAGFLEKPVAVLGDPGAIEQTIESGLPGMRFGAYELVREIGRGGMGAVFLAVRADNEYRKQVAIKVIRGGMESPMAVQRFRNERQILARLEHPNIARLIDGGTTAHGSPYFIMEYVEGTPIREFCRHHNIPARDRIGIYLKVCSAVHYAHRRMIIHRDLKPTNVLVKQDGTPKLLDFGIAKLLGPDTDPAGENTLSGMLACTPAYASPEQLRGEPATVQSDIYSLGIVLFELLSGERPSPSAPDRLPTPAGAPPDCAELLNGGLRDVIAKAIRPAPADRYQSVESFAADIERCLSQEAPGPASPGASSLAVLPFRVLSPDPADNYLGLGITDAIITKLSNIGRISVRSSSAVMQYTDTTDVPAAGRELGVDHILEGRVQRSGDRVRVTVQLVRVDTGATVWAVGFDEQFKDLLVVEDSISGQVAQALVPQLTGEEREHLARGGTASAKAYEACLRGRWHWNKHTEEDRARALVAFQEAIAADPKYARAHAGVADYYVQLGIWGGLPPSESFAAAKVSAQNAIEIDPALAEAHASLGFALWAFDRDYSAAAHEFQLAITLNPDYANAHLWFGLLNSCRGRHDIALASVERAARLAPAGDMYVDSLAICYYYAGRVDRSMALLQDSIGKDAAHAPFHEILAWGCLAAGDVSAALREARRAVHLDGGTPLSLCALAHAEAAAGNTAEPLRILRQLQDTGRQRYVSAFAIGLTALACGDRRQALEWLERSWQDRDWWVMWAGSGPRWDALRGESRYHALLNNAGLSAARQPAAGQPPAAAPKTARRIRSVWAAAAALLLVAIVAAVVWFQRGAARPVPFRQTRLTKVTSNGLAVAAAMSRDGGRILYTTNAGGRMELWLREQAAGRTTRLAGPYDTDVRDLQFTRNDSHAAFVTFSRKDPARGRLHLVSLAGGAPEQMMSDVHGPMGISRDGSRIAVIRADAEAGFDELLIAALDGSNRRRVAMQRYPDRFSWNMAPSWSPDGKRLAYGFASSDDHGFYMGIMVTGVDAGAPAPVKSPRWQRMDNITWSMAGDALYVVGQEQESSFEQIWYLPLKGGQPARITNDLSDYNGADVTADNRALLSVQQLNLSNVYTMGLNDTTPVQVTPGGGRYFDISWAPGNRLVYASDATGSADIWSMKADGKAQQQLTVGAGRSYSPVPTPDGKYIVFHSNRVGNWNIWRMDADGRNFTQLTFGNRDSNWPQVTPDGQFVLYHHTGTNAMFNIWRVPVAGGRPVQLTAQLTMHPAVAPDGRIACWYSEEVATPRWKIAIFPPNGGTPSRTFEPPENVTPDTTLRWTPKGDALTMVDGRNGVSNLWIMPIDGRPGYMLTRFASGLIYAFDWSPSGKLALSQGVTTTDVVLIRDERTTR